MENFKSFRNQVLKKDAAVKKFYNELEPEFALIEKLIEKRLKQGWTQQELARRVGTKQPVISRLESGGYNPSIKFLHRVTDALGAKLSVKVS